MRAMKGVLLRPRAWGGAQSSRAARSTAHAVEGRLSIDSAKTEDSILKNLWIAGDAASPTVARPRTAHSHRMQTRRAAAPWFRKRNPRRLWQWAHVSDRNRPCRSHRQLSTSAQVRRMWWSRPASASSSRQAGQKGLVIAPTALPSSQTYKPTGLQRVESAMSCTRPSESRQALAQAETAAAAGAKSRPQRPMDRSWRATLPARALAFSAARARNRAWTRRRSPASQASSAASRRSRPPSSPAASAAAA